MSTERLRIAVSGIVQGVGFRPFVYGLAARLGVGGHVTNRDGDVVIEAEGASEVLPRFVDELRLGPGRIDRVVVEPIEALGETHLAILESENAQGTAAIAPDLATCAACIAEITTAGERRAGYAFTSCASCGPRLTIVTQAPYDRERTTMAPFAMCAACHAEYTNAADRRFHAQPIACPACGPTLACDGDAVDPIGAAVRAIERGEIVAIKGLGGYHLACDARRDDVVAELRRRKQRDAKPFAVMVADVDAARSLATLTEAEVALLGSAARPIVLVTPNATGLSTAIAPRMADLGLMLPYTPLHHLLVRALPGVPLVMTSGNVTDEPIAFRDADARERLGSIADRFLTHDREIRLRCEDSVARVIDGAPVILRRARGYAPAPIALDRPLAEPTLAVGGHLKAAFALGAGDVAFVSPHLGDLDHLAAYEAFVDALDHLGALHRVFPKRVVHDLHPDYATTRLAELLGLPRIAVQHHHAHFASALADAGVHDRALGVVFDGAGLGTDGTIWGGEILLGDRAHSERAAHLRQVPLPGGDRAAAEPWRMEIAMLREAGEPIDDVITRIGSRARQVAALCDAAPRTSSAGRLFDAVAALIGIADDISFEGEAAMRLEALARTVPDAGSYPIEIAGRVLDTLPVVRAVVRDRARGVAQAVIARRFHTTVVELAAAACIRLAAEHRIRDVVISGGVFQNAILAAELPTRLRAASLVPHLQRHVPMNDGGLSLGQLATVAARDAGGE